MKLVLTPIKFIFLTSFVLCINNKITGQNIPNAKPGKCYAKSRISYVYHKEENVTMAIFTGDTTTNIQLDTIYFKLDTVLLFDRVYLGKREELNNRNMKDILLLEKFVIVKNKNETDKYIEETISYFKLEKEEVYTDWKEVLCNDKVSTAFIKKLQVALIEEGYLDNSHLSSGIFDEKLKDALNNYQKDMRLPIGNLDYDTLRSLKIKI